MALNGLFCADVPLRNYSLTHSALIYSLRTPCSVLILQIVISVLLDSLQTVRTRLYVTRSNYWY